MGKLVTLDGDPGLGKSSVTLDLAARVSSGLPLPGGEEFGPAGVVLLSIEDGLADTVRPRLEAAGANLTRVLSLETVSDRDQRLPGIPDDVPSIESAIYRVDAKLVVIDPLMAFLSPEINSHRDQDVRRALAPLTLLAERTGAAFVLVRHLNKADGRSPLYRGGGSIGFIAAARAGLLMGVDPTDSSLRVLAASKSNLSRKAPSLSFRIVEVPGGSTRVEWLGESAVGAEDLLGDPPSRRVSGALEDAKGILGALLANGPIEAKKAQEECLSAGIAPRTLDRAKQELGVRCRKTGFGQGWVWSLPHEDRQTSQEPEIGDLGDLGAGQGAKKREDGE